MNTLPPPAPYDGVRLSYERTSPALDPRYLVLSYDAGDGAFIMGRPLPHVASPELLEADAATWVNSQSAMPGLREICSFTPPDEAVITAAITQFGTPNIRRSRLATGPYFSSIVKPIQTNDHWTRRRHWVMNTYNGNKTARFTRPIPEYDEAVGEHALRACTVTMKWQTLWRAITVLAVKSTLQKRPSGHVPTP